MNSGNPSGMPSQRITRVNEILKREIATILHRVMQDQPDVDMATMTVTDVDTSPDLRQAHVLVSVRGDDAVASRTISRLNGKRKEIQNDVMKSVVLKYTPRLHFKRDTSIARGAQVLEILGTLAEPELDDIEPHLFEGDEDGA